MRALSQLPFGFDVDWYIGWLSSVLEPRLCLNCLSALMLIGTAKNHITGNWSAVSSQLPFGFDVDWYSRSRGRPVTSSGGLNCLSALMLIGTWLSSGSLSMPTRSLNCLSALMSIGTGDVYAGTVDLAMQSQLPFGFDVDWYTCISREIRGRPSCLNCLSALMSIGTRIFRGGDLADIRSQLPFGFDVDWYLRKRRMVMRSTKSSLNCLSALMSIGTVPYFWPLFQAGR